MALKDLEVQRFFDRKKIKLNIELKNSSRLNEEEVEPKWSQSGDKVEPQLEPFAELSRAKLEPKWSQSGNKVEPQLEPPTELSIVKLESKWSQNGQEQNTTISFSQLVGLQKKIILCIYENSKIARSNSSQALTIDFINTYCKTTTCSIKKAIQRLIKKGVLIRKNFKNGRSGWTCYELPKFLYYEIVHMENGAKVGPKWGQSEAKLEAQLETQLEPRPFSSSSANILNTTTTNENRNSNLLQSQVLSEWQNIDLEPLSNIGITKTHLSQIVSQNKLSAEVVQDSIYAFSFDLEVNNKTKNINGDPINYFMGILRKGIPYLPPSNYESPQDKAMRLYRESKRKIEQKRVEAEKEAIDLAFSDWFSKLADEQKIEFLPELLRRKAIQRNANGEKPDKSKILESSARSYFEKEVWLSEKEKIITNKG